MNPGYPGTVSSQPPSEKIALIVDDSSTMRQLLVHAVGKVAELSAIEAIDGVDALEKIADWVPTIILADINMPVMDGFKLVQRIRSESRFAATPIIVISTEDGVEDREQALALGANAFITKPIVAPQVVSLIRELLAAVSPSPVSSESV